MQHDGELPVLKPNGSLSFQHENTRYDLIENQGHYEILEISAFERRHKMYVTFSPALPDIGNLKDGSSTGGRFRIGIDTTPDVIQGVYRVECEGSRVHMEMYPDKNWQPRGTWLTRLTFLFFPPAFRTWVRTYRWSAVIETNRKTQTVTMKSGWQRR
jgi:hypothetical protein